MKKELEYEKEQEDIGREDKEKIKELEKKINDRLQKQKLIKKEIQKLKEQVKWYNIFIQILYL